MITDNVDGVNRDALKHIFDNIEYPYTLDEILQMTHALVDGMEREERENVINNLDDFINQVMESGIQEGTPDNADKRILQTLCSVAHVAHAYDEPPNHWY